MEYVNDRLYEADLNCRAKSVKAFWQASDDSCGKKPKSEITCLYFDKQNSIHYAHRWTSHFSSELCKEVVGQRRRKNMNM